MIIHIIKNCCLYILQFVLHMWDSPEISHKLPILMMKILIYCGGTFVFPLLKLYFHNQVFFFSCPCLDIILHQNLWLRYLHELQRGNRSLGMMTMLVKLLLLLTFLKLFCVASSSGWVFKPLIPLNYFWCYLSLIDQKAAVLFFKNLLHNVYSTPIVQVLFLDDQYLMVHWWQDLLLLWC